jgi:hypothetical protein
VREIAYLPNKEDFCGIEFCFIVFVSPEVGWEEFIKIG